MRLKKSNLYVIFTSLIYLLFPSLGYDLHSHLLITSDLNLILNDFLNFKLFEIYIPRYNLFPIFIWFGSFGGILPASTFFLIIYYLIINDFCNVVNRFRLTTKFFLTIIFSYFLLGFGVFDVSMAAISINILSRKDNISSYNWNFLSGLISWPGFLLSNIFLIFRLLTNKSKFLLRVILSRLLIINSLTLFFIIVLNKFFQPNTTRDYGRYLDLLISVESFEDLMKIPKLPLFLTFLGFIIVVYLIIKSFFGRYILKIINFLNFRISSHLLIFLLVTTFSIYSLYPKLIANNPRIIIYPPLIYSTGLIRGSDIPREKKSI